MEKLEKILQMRNEKRHHIHIKFGDQIHTIIHTSDYIEFDELMPVLEEIAYGKKVS